MLRAGLVGFGIMGAHHARLLANLEGVQLVAIADTQKIVNINFPGVEILRTVEEIIDKKVDYCVVAAPTAFHEEISLKLIDANIHVLIEKPIAHTLESAITIKNYASSSGVLGAVGHIERFNAALQQARHRIAAGQLGKIYQVATRRTGPFPSRIADVGVILDLATHDIDTTAWISDSTYRVVSAQSVRKSGREHEDLVAIVGQLENGIVVNHLVNWLSPLKERKTIITGEKGTFVVDTLSSDLTYYANGTVLVNHQNLAHFTGVSQGDVMTYAFSKPEPLRVQHENFRNLIIGKKNESVSLESATKTVEVAEAILKSCEMQRSVIV